jgi:hypothetical protein
MIGYKMQNNKLEFRFRENIIILMKLLMQSAGNKNIFFIITFKNGWPKIK